MNNEGLSQIVKRAKWCTVKSLELLITLCSLICFEKGVWYKTIFKEHPEIKSKLSTAVCEIGMLSIALWASVLWFMYFYKSDRVLLVKTGKNTRLNLFLVHVLLKKQPLFLCPLCFEGRQKSIKYNQYSIW